MPDTRRSGSLRGAVAAALGALVLFGPSANDFEARVTDLSALRLLNGEVPYRDFWTMYAPGSFVTLAVAFAAFGRELIVSNILGILTSAAAVGVYFWLACRVVDAWTAVAVSALMAVALYGTGYHNGFTSFPPALLLILVAVGMTARRVSESGWQWTIAPGIVLGAAAFYKHDVAAYATAAAAAAVFVARRSSHALPVWTPMAGLAAASSAVVVSVVVALIALGAGPAAWRDLVEFPGGDFRIVRPEDFPILPRLEPTPIATIQSLVRWGICNVPLVALVAGVPGVWRRWPDLDALKKFTVAFAFVAFWLHWVAAHVQLNTHAISLAMWSALFCGVGLGRVGRQPAWATVLAAGLVGWGGLFVARPIHDAIDGGAWRQGQERASLPRLSGIRLPAAQARMLRDLAAAIRDAGPPDARLLFLSHRNDINIYAQSVPFWLTDRRPANAHHELHPGVTDTEASQRATIEALMTQPLPVVVREHRFADHVLDDARDRIGSRVPVGATVIDRWIADRYKPGPRYGRYEVMHLRQGRR